MLRQEQQEQGCYFRYKDRSNNSNNKVHLLDVEVVLVRLGGAGLLPHLGHQAPPHLSVPQHPLLRASLRRKYIANNLQKKKTEFQTGSSTCWVLSQESLFLMCPSSSHFLACAPPLCCCCSELPRPGCCCCCCCCCPFPEGPFELVGLVGDHSSWSTANTPRR